MYSQRIESELTELSLVVRNILLHVLLYFLVSALAIHFAVKSGLHRRHVLDVVPHEVPRGRVIRHHVNTPLGVFGHADAQRLAGSPYDLREVARFQVARLPAERMELDLLVPGIDGGVAVHGEIRVRGVEAVDVLPVVASGSMFEDILGGQVFGPLLAVPAQFPIQFQGWDAVPSPVCVVGFQEVFLEVALGDVLLELLRDLRGVNRQFWYAIGQFDVVVVGVEAFWRQNVLGEVAYDVAWWRIVSDDHDFAAGFGEGHAQFLGISPYHLKGSETLRPKKPQIRGSHLREVSRSQTAGLDAELVTLDLLVPVLYDLLARNRKVGIGGLDAEQVLPVLPIIAVLEGVFLDQVVGPVLAEPAHLPV